MKKFFAFILLGSVCYSLHSQNSILTIHNNATISINNGASIILDNPNNDAISLSGTGGKIVSEGEQNKIYWNIKNNTGTYVIPFSNSAGEKIPVIADIITNGDAGGRIAFSTYGGNWDNSTYLPSPVVHFLDAETATQNNSEKAIDRFWIIDAQNYGTKPTVTLSISYLESEISAIGNSIDEANLQAQRYNTVQNTWGDMSPAGIVNTATKMVNSIDVAPADFFNVWTLVDKSSPLPIVLSYFEVECIGENRQIIWQTASEINNDYFKIERSLNAIDYFEISRIPGAGNSNTPKFYSFTDWENINHNTYYRITQVDFDGQSKTYPPKNANCHSQINENFVIWAIQAPDGMEVNIQAPYDEIVTIYLYDGIGKIIFSTEKNLHKGHNKFILPIDHISTALYLLKARMNSGYEKTIKNFIKKEL